ncbi:MAG: type II secretion system protein [Aureliella sp.]
MWIRCKNFAAFTLIELVVVLLIVGILAAAALPKFFDKATDSEASAIAKHLRVIRDQAELFLADNGRWPSNSLPSNFPSDFGGYLDAGAFSGNPLGGRWDWNGPGSQVGKIGPNLLVAGSLTATQLKTYEQVDAILDDGKLSSGKVQLFRVAGHLVLQVIQDDG